MFFFIDPAKLINTQTDAQAYGPVEGAETIKYRVTSKFQLSTSTPAIAALDGIVLVQPHATDPMLCNIALKVNDLDDSRTQFDKIDYIIYRGLLRSSFLTTATTPTLLPADPSNSGLMADIWAHYTKAQADAAKLGLPTNFLPPTADWLGFNRTVTTQTLEAAFADTSRLAPLASAKAGKSLGTFAAHVDAGIEFVIFDRFYQPTVADLRRAEMVFEVATTPTSVAGHDDSYETQRTRENILNYIDPAAYYTMHYRKGVEYKDSAGTVHPCSDVPAIMQRLLGSFKTKNCLYLDIRNELGGSLNFYRDNEGLGADQNKHIALGFDAQNLSPVSYYTNNWPIFSLVDISAASNLGNLYVAFRQAHNPRPLLYVDYGYGYTFPTGPELLTNQNRFVDCTDSGKDWSLPLPLKMLPPTTVGSGHPVWFVKLMCIRQQVPADLATTVPSAPPRHYNLDGVFGPLRADMLVSKNTNYILPGKKYMAGLSGGAIVQIRRIQGADEVTFLAERLAAYGTSSTSPFAFTALWAPRFYDTSPATKWLVQPGVITKQVNLEQNGTSITILRQDLTMDGSTVAAPAPSLTLLTQQVQDYILPALTSFSPQRDEVFIAFDAVTKGQEVLLPPRPFEAKKYISAQLKLTGLLANGTYTSTNPLSVLTCYTLDSVVFVTQSAALHLPLEKISNPDAYIKVNKIIDYVKAVEASYAADDGRTTAARIRVQYYGSSIPIIEDKKSFFPFVSTYLKGQVFNYAVAHAPSNVSLDYGSMQQTPASREAYSRLLTHADENGIESNPSPYIVFENPNTKIFEYIDLGHALYGFEAWQWKPGGPASSYATLPYPVYDSADLAGLPGDIAPAVGEFLNQLTNPLAYQDRAYYPTATDLGAFYHISNPDADALSDADGLGVSNAFNNLPTIPGQKTRLSQALEVYYATTPFTSSTLPGLKNHYLDSHYSRRWMRLADEYGFLQRANRNLDKYDAKQSFYWIGDHLSMFTQRYQTFYNRVRAVANIIYNGEVNKTAIGVRIYSGAPFIFKLIDIMTVTTPDTRYPNVDSVINSIIKEYLFPDFKLKILAENPAIKFEI